MGHGLFLSGSMTARSAAAHENAANILAIMLTLMLDVTTACGGNTGTKPQAGQTGGAQAGKNLLDTIKANGKLRVGTEGTCTFYRS
ncbi:hypothetical protein FHS19_000507 [Paenibacillus rhizosphaerae]|uniref:Uncharacterized protein n=1 Tax=Paenibacillus rhizosphaerae TaxID=297318 RepID=A0A839TH68_9BACL|nr:hypothetical protein [Paenibacillus rhizosphaerae]